jgi:exodeoxyribonuclease-3
MLKLISLNVNGLRAASRKGLSEWLCAEDPDILCVQELKAQEKDLVPFQRIGRLEGFFHPAKKPGYSGVAVYSKHEPLRVIKGFGIEEFDDEGRYIQLDFPSCSIVSLYLPSGSSSDERQRVKFAFLKAFFPHLEKLKSSGREVILCGDWNIAHQTIDLKNWKNNQNKSGFLPEERHWLSQVFETLNFVDVWRDHHKTIPGYTWWSQRGRAYDNDVGWRIDYHIVTPNIAATIQNIVVQKHPKFSDHAPLIGYYDLSLTN